MKKFSFLSLCALMVSFVSTGAFAAKSCGDYGVTQPNQLVLRLISGSGYSVYSCVDHTKGNSTFTLKTGVDFCRNAQSGCPDGYKQKDIISGRRALCVKDGADVSEGKNADGLNYYVLNEFLGKETACYACMVGYQFDSQYNKCVEVNDQSCGVLVSDICKDNPAYLTVPAAHGCYSCKQKEKGSCSNGNRVYAQSAFLGGKTTGDKDTVWTCLAGQKRWNPEPLKLCDGSVDLSADYNARPRRAEKVIVNPDTNTSYNNASSVVVLNGEICFKYVCNEDLGYKEQNGKCVVDSGPQELCTKNGGEYSDGKCTCSESRGLKPSDDGKTCKCTTDDHVWDSSKNKCEKDPDVIEREKKKQDCEESGGIWGDEGCVCNGAHLKKIGDECACVSGYRWNGSICVMTDITRSRNECDAAKKADERVKWEGNECKCIDNRMVFIDKKCVLDPKIERCEKIKGAYWDWNVSDVDKCRCKNSEYELRGDACVLSPDIAKCRAISGADWVDNECKCMNPDMELNGAKTACVETATSIAKKRAGVAYDALRKIHDDFEGKRSVWKDKSGNFNTARLASDSIAGVVLGTAGGLITSNVVKKNQIESGFEDIKCTIGGQNVADWGDQFRVGIQ